MKVVISGIGVNTTCLHRYASTRKMYGLDKGVAEKLG